MPGVGSALTTTGSSSQLAERLFVPEERWGWEFVPPTPPVPSPLLSARPLWAEPPGPDLQALHWKRNQAMGKLLPKRAIILGVLVLLTLSMAGSTIVPFLLVLVLAAFWIVPIILASNQISAAERTAGASRDLAHRSFLQATREWEAEVRRHDEAERRRVESAMAWFPLSLRTGPSRIDVFGGTGDGWASLLATLGATLLQRGDRILLLDLSEQDVGGGLAMLAGERRIPVMRHELPAELGRFAPLAGLDAEETADLIADAIQSRRTSDDGGTARATDVDLVRAVVDRLDQPVTFGKLTEGLKVLQRQYDPDSGTRLSGAELSRLAAAVDIVGSTDTVQGQLRFLVSTAQLLAGQDETGQLEVADLWPEDGLAILATADRQDRRKDLTDRVLFQYALHEIRRGRVGQRGVLVVAGADHLGREALEAMARQARRARVRLVLLLEHLRGDLQQLLGGSDSAAVLMRLGNSHEAEEAARFVGRGHTFALSQLTRQVGRTFTEGRSRSWGGQESYSETSGASWNSGHGPGGASSGRSRSDSVTSSRGRTWQDTKNTSIADSQSDGTTVARSYDFRVEPTAIQELPPTSFFLAESGQVVLGDCNPGIVFLDKVSTAPRPR